MSHPHVTLDAFVVAEFADGKIVRLRPHPDRAAAEQTIANLRGLTP